MPTETSAAKCLGNFLGISLAVVFVSVSPSDDSDLPVVADALAPLLLCHVHRCRDANLASQEHELLPSSPSC